MTDDVRILIVEDDEAIATGLSMNLRLEGYSAEIACDGESATDAIAAIRPTLILLDIGLPKKDGIELLRELRAAGDLTPVVVLSARGSEFDKVGALRLGADDYITKPFALAELMARVDAVLRRAVPSPATVADDGPQTRKFGSVALDHSTRTVTRDGDLVKLTHLEFELLWFFVSHPSEVLSRSKLLREVWGIRGTGSRRTVDNFVAQLRSKLETDPEQPAHFVTVRGSGYRFEPE